MNKKLFPSDRDVLLRKALAWWDNLPIPKKYDYKKLCYPNMQTRVFTDEQKIHMFNLLKDMK